MKVVKRIKRSGWPVFTRKGIISKIWKKAHKIANLAEKKRFGSKAFKAVNRIAKKIPKNELLGSHTRKGKIMVSSRVPKKYRNQIAYHERVEHRIMSRRKKY